MATTFKVLGNGTPVLSMRKWVNPKPKCIPMNFKLEDCYEKTDIIDEDDLCCEWSEVRDKYPNTTKEEFELQQKEFQEV